MRWALAALALVAAARPAAANPLDVYGFGGRAPGMAGAATAVVDDGSANYYNPAGLALAREVRFDLGYQAALPHLTIDGGDQGVAPSRGLVLCATIPLRLRGRQLATIGTGMWLPDQQLLIGRTLAANQPRWLLHDNRAQRFFFAAHLAASPLPNLQIGAGIAVVATTGGSWVLTGRLGYPDSYDSALELAVDVDVTPVIYPQAGVRWEPTDRLTVGATYRGQFVARAVEIIRFDADIGPAGMEPIVDDALLALTAVALDMFQPAQLAVGGAVQASPRLLLAADATYSRWSRFGNPTPTIDLEYDVGVLNQFVMIGEQAELEDPHFHDTLALRAGAELHLGDPDRGRWRLRAGYAWDPSPAPEQVGESNFVDSDRHTVAMGVGTRVGPWGGLLVAPVEINAFLAATVLPQRTHRKLSPVDPIGDYRGGGRVLAAGLTTSWRF